MEKWQLQFVTKNILALQQNTIVNAMVLAHLRSANILGPADIDKLNAIRNIGELEASSKLYDILRGRENSYKILMQSLKYTCQSGAYTILRNGYKHKLLESVQSKIPHFEMDDLEAVLKTDACQSDYENVFIPHEEKFQLVRNTIPGSTGTSLRFYVPRLISNRIILKPEVFEQKSTDIFVFKGITRVELSKLAGSESTSMSSTQLSRIKSRFILLELEDDWMQLKRLAKSAIHLVNVEKFGLKVQRTYVLEETSGHSTVIWMYTQIESKEKRVYTSEKDFVEKLTKESSNWSGVCICDSPGMGKSWLLASLASQFEKCIPKALVAFVPLGQFIFKQKLNLKMSNVTALNTLLDFICTCNLSQAIVLRAVQKGYITLYLFFDGFDEIHPTHVELAHSFLQSILKFEKCVKIFITSRPHMRAELEQKYGVIAYDILPFSELTRMQFLVDTWKLKNETSDVTKLERFASVVLKQFEKVITKEQHDFLGNPLMCYLLSEVLLEEVNIFANPKRECITVETLFSKTNAVYELYGKLLEMRFGKDKLENSEARNYHMWKAFATIFPEISDDIKAYLNCKEMLPMVILSSYGILEFSETGEKEVATFAHLTFAEFLVAEFIGNTFLCQHTSGLNIQKLFEIFKDKILQVVPYIYGRLEMFSSKYSCDLYIFSHTVILNFLNSHFDIYNGVQLVPKFLDDMEPHSLSFILQSCILHNFVRIFQFLKVVINLSSEEKRKGLERCTFSLNPEDWADPEQLVVKITSYHFLLQSAATFADREMLEECHGFFRDVLDLDEKVMFQSIDATGWTPLHSAVQRANYDITEYLVRLLPMENREYLHVCIKQTYNQSQKTIQAKRDICELLLNANKNLLFELSDLNKNPVLLEESVSLDLLKFLIESGADVTAVRQIDKFTVIHQAMKCMCCSDFEVLCRYLLVNQKAKQIFRVNCDTWDNPLFHLVYSDMKISPATLQMILSECNININGSFKKPNNTICHAFTPLKLLHAAIVRNQSLEILKCLVKQGADSKLRDKNGLNALHFAIENFNTDAIAYLMFLGMSLNDRDEHGNDYILYTAEAKNSFDIVKFYFLLWCGASIHTTNHAGESIAFKLLSVKRFNILFKLIVWLCRNSVDDAVKILNCQNSKQKTIFDIDWQDDYISYISDIYKIITKRCNFSLEKINNIFIHVIEMQLEISVLNLLLSCGANFKCCNQTGKSAIQIAAEVKSRDAVVFLFYLDTELSYLDTKEKRLLYQALVKNFDYALYANKTNSEQTLLQDAIFNMLNWKYDAELGNTYLFLAPVFYDPESYHKFVETLFQNEHQHLFHTTNSNSQTPLHFAIFFLNLKSETVELIARANLDCRANSEIKCYAYLNAVDKDGHSVIHYALLAKKDLRTVEHLVKIGVKLDLVDNEGRTLADICHLLELHEHLEYFLNLRCKKSTIQNVEWSKATLFKMLKICFVLSL